VSCVSVCLWADGQVSQLRSKLSAQAFDNTVGNVLNDDEAFQVPAPLRPWTLSTPIALTTTLTFPPPTLPY
jgi:hypothetical protein